MLKHDEIKATLLYYNKFPLILPKRDLHLQFRREILVHQLQSLPDLCVHRAEQFSAQLVKQSRQQYKQPHVQVARVHQNQLVHRVQKQRIHLGVCVAEHCAKQIDDAVQVLRRQSLVVRQILRQIGETVFAVGPVQRGALVENGFNVLGDIAKGVQLVSRSVPGARLKMYMGCVWKS